MKKRILKYEIKAQPIIEFEMPKGAEIISVQLQHGNGAMWAICDTSAELETRIFAIYGTGHYIPNDPLKYIGTYQEQGGLLVWHVFEVL